MGVTAALNCASSVGGTGSVRGNFWFSGLTKAPLRFIAKWRCGPVVRPVFPE